MRGGLSKSPIAIEAQSAPPTPIELGYIFQSVSSETETRYIKFKVGTSLEDLPKPNLKVSTVNIATRRQLEEAIEKILLSVGDSTKVRIGFDFSLGFPEKIALRLAKKFDSSRQLIGSSANRSIASFIIDEIGAQVQDGQDNSNNRFAVASDLNKLLGMNYFWGLPTSVDAEVSELDVERKKRPLDTDLEYRIVERKLMIEQGLRPSSIRQLVGAGAVGGQSILGMANISRLIRRIGSERVSLWPFDSSSRKVTIFEIWPTLTVPKSQLRSYLSNRTHLKAPLAVDGYETVAVLDQLSHIELPTLDGLASQIADTMLIDVNGAMGERANQNDLEIQRHKLPALREALKIEGWIANLAELPPVSTKHEEVKV
ncbi:MAG: hypothetical protein M0019_10120 [Actinomycetota bacterium]|nr:hypothetical protein [Actinomycetota bacterium]